MITTANGKPRNLQRLSEKLLHDDHPDRYSEKVKTISECRPVKSIIRVFVLYVNFINPASK